ncbi:MULTISPECIES: hypothetical protein [unclassified Streptomyces]|uniref:hypothetical protein n=1 Tax=unclassified Streptomyces TaxID=2593676 RepID=UPI00225BAA97|nr:hypothetical protein [Streptomyces sp. NBC_00340]MCX5138248.1 hypothetical protein [Streptomyces sp. NBC_00340]
MTDQLDQFPAGNELFGYRGVPGVHEDAPSIAVPWHQGDVCQDVELPGIGVGYALIFLHPCTLRRGAVLDEYVTMVEVRERHASKVMEGEKAWIKHWATGNYSLMPLPNMLNAAKTGGTHVADFRKIATVPSRELSRLDRVATLSDDGRAYLLQRSFHHFSRVVVPLGDIRAGMRAVNLEISLQQDWVEGACRAAKGIEMATVEQAEIDFDNYLKENDRRLRLGQLEEQAAVSKEVAYEIGRRFGVE